MRPPAPVGLSALFNRLTQRTHFEAARISWRSISCQLISLLLTHALLLQLVPRVATAAPSQPSKSSLEKQASENRAGKFNSNLVTGAAEGASNVMFPPTFGGGDVSPATMTDSVVTRHKPTLNSGSIDGTLRVLLGESFTINGNTQLTSDLFLPGTPTITLNGGSHYGATVNDGGSATPTNYTLTLNGGVNLASSIHTHVDALQLPTDFPNSVPSPSGTRTISITSQSAVAGIGNWQTVRDLSVTGSHITIDVPPGNYGTFTVNGNSQLNFAAGTYNFSNAFNLDGSATVQATGLVAINVGQNVTVNSGALVLGSYTSPGDLHLNVLGSLLNVNGSSQVSGLVRAYNGTVTLNGTAQVRGQVIANSVVLNGSSKIIGAVWPAQSANCPTVFGPRRFDRTTGPQNQYVEQFSLPAGFTSPITLHVQNGATDGTHRVSSATVKLNGADILSPSDLNQNVASLDRTVSLAANNQLDVRVASSPGSYLIINICGTIPVTDTTPPAIAITSPANNSTTTATQTTVTGTATDVGAGATGVAHVYVNNVEAAYNSAAGTWTISNVALALGSNQIAARAVDQAGNQATASITVTRQSPTNHAPTADAGPDQTLTLPQTASLHGLATDDGLRSGSTLTTTWSKVTGPGTVTFANANALDTTATFNTAGTYVLRLTATDGALSTTDDVTITVQPQNQPPTVSAGPNQTIALPHTATLNGTVSDDGLPAGSTVTTTWSQVSGPGTVTFEDATLTDTNASFSAAGTYVLRLTANDGELSAKSDVTITVQPENHAPTVSAGQNQTVSLPNAAAQLSGSASDDGLPYGSSLTVSWSIVSGPASVVFDNPNSTTTVAHFAVAGSYVLRLTATDGELSSTADVTITVTPPNQAPSVNAGADQAVTLPNVASLNGTVGDDGLPLGSSVSTLWSTISGPGTVTFANPNVTVTTASFSAPGSYVLRLSASDTQLSSSDDVVITVTSPNQAPVVNAGADQNIGSFTANLQGSATDDGLPTGSVLAISWSKVNGPGTVIFSDGSNLNTAVSFSAAGSYVLRLTANDSQLSSSDDVTITVTSNQPPVADFGGASSGGPLQLTTVSYSSYNNDGYETYHPKQLLDANSNTYWQTASGQVSNQFAVFRPSDGQAALIDRVRLQNAFGPDGTNVHDFEVQVSAATANASDFHSVLIGSLPNNPTSGEFVFPGGPVTARFIKLVIVSNYGSSTFANLSTFQPVSAGGLDSIVSFLGKPNSALNQSPALVPNGGAIYNFSFGGTYNTPDPMLGYSRGGWVTTSTANQFAIIQLGGGKLYTLDGIKIATWYDLGYGFPTGVKDFEVWVSSTTPDASSFTRVLSATVAFNPQLQTFTFPGGPVQARYVKYVPLNNGGGGPVINTPMFDVIAEGVAKVVGASGQLEYATNSPEQAFDGNLNTFWYGPNGVGSDVWVKTSLEDETIHKVSGVRITPLNSYYYGLRGPKDFDIRVSTTTTDDSAFTTVYSGTLSGAVSNDAQEFVFSNPVDAKYVEFYWKNSYGGSTIAVSELEVLADSAHGSTLLGYSSTSDLTSQGPANALDIDTTSAWTTANGQNVDQWLKLSLPGTDLFTIDHVALMPGFAHCGFTCIEFSVSPKDFEVQVSTTDAADASFVTVHSGTLQNTATLQHFSFAPVQARYVRLLLRNNYGSGSIALLGFYVYTSDHGSTDTRFVDRSTDSDGHIVSWAWDFGDGGTSTDESPLHHYAAAGTYTVRLTVTDNGGLTASHQMTFKASGSALTPNFSFSPVTANEGAEFVRFTDTTELLMQPFGRRVFDFGNGFSVTDLYQATYYPYQFPDSGSFNVTMTIGDDNGLKTSVTKPITVLNLPPSVTVDAGKTVLWGESWTNAPHISDPSPIDSQTLHGVWDFGDGQTFSCNNCNNTSATATHAYALPGVYTATLTVTDKDGGAGTATATYTVNRRPTALVFQNPPTQTTGAAFVIHARLTDTFANVTLSGKPVQFNLNGAIFNAVTGADGVAEVSVPLPAGTKIDIITGTFAGDSLYLNCGGVGVPVTAGSAPPSGTLGSQGTNFWSMFPHNYFDGYGLAIQRLYISSRVDTSGTVTIPGGGFNFMQNFTVQANTITTIQLPFVQVYESNIIQAKGIHVTSQQPVTVYGLNQRVFTSDAFLALPVNTLGTDHFILTYSNMGFAPSSEFGVVATEDNTTVTITPAVTTGTRIGGVPYSIVLNQGQTYLLQNTVPDATGDLTGSHVSSDKPIAVFGGHQAATIPAEAGCCADHLVEQMTPINVWGKRFATVPIATRTKGDFFRFIASQDGTAVYLNGSLTAMLNRGQWAERIIKDPAEIIATAPIMVAQYSTSVFYDPPTTGKADPFEMIIPPYSQFLNHYTVSTPGTGFAINYANVVAPTASLGSITLDGNPIPASSFTAIGVSGYSGAQVSITVGMHNFDGPASFGVFIYGFNQDEGYGYPGGMNMSATGQSTNVVLSPETLARPINGQACLVATVTNQDQFPLGGRTVNFTVTGANAANSSATTDAAGQAQFCYTGTNLGSDLVRAAVDSASGTASVQWLTDVPNQPPVVNAGADQTITLPAAANLQGSVTDDGLPGYTLNISWSKVSGPGNVTFANSASVFTTATFGAAGVYVLRLTASDTSLSASDDVQITVNPTPTNQAPTANAGPDLSAAIKGNLIINPGNDQPLVNGKIPGWIEEQGTTWTQGNSSIAGLPDPHRGNSFFYVGSDGAQYAELRQDIDVSAFASTIAAGTQQFEIQAFIRQAPEFPYPDYPQVVLEYRNAQNDGLVGSLNSYSTYTPGSWSPVQAVNTVPIGTGWVRVRLIATRNQGATNDAYFDSISLRPVGNTAVKLNGTVADDGLPFGSSVSANWTQVSGPAAVTFTNANAANSQVLFTTPGTYVLRLTAGDGQLNASDHVTVTINPVNQPPSVGGSTNQTITMPATAPLNGIVSDDGLPVGSTVSAYWKKDQGPGIVTFANPNAASTTASFSTPGFYVLLLTADDSEYSASTPFYVSVNPSATNQPPVVNAGPDQTITLPTSTANLNGAAADDGLPAGSTLVVQWTQVSGPALASFANPNSAVTTAQFSTAGTYVLRLNASDGQLTTSDDVRITVTAQNQPPTVNAGADQTTILSAGAQLNGSVSDDGLPTGSTLTTTWSKVSGPGTVAFGNPNVTVTSAQFSVTGAYVLRLTASDGALSASDDVTITVNDNVAPPTVQITAPEDGGSVTDPTIVTGSVSGGDWKLEYSLDSDDNANNRFWTTFASGNGAASGTLGTIDPTTMLNGLFDIRLSATDQFGQISRTKVSVIVERNLKVGNFTVSFTDLSIPVAGVPMEVTRTYDSRDKRVGDFGFGWTLGLHNIRVEKSSVVGLKWFETVSQEAFPNYCLDPVGSHAVTVTFPGGKVFKFQPSVAPRCQRTAPITSANISFTPMPGTVGKLEVVGSSDVQIDGSVPGPVNLVGFGGGVNIFNSFVFKFTAEDGTAYIIDQRTGLQSLADSNGNTLTISAGGIVHSSGKSIVFNRDIAGRITSIVDPNGNPQFYNYDPNGDLISYTDNENNTSTYTYDANHRLLTIHDPRGIQPIRNDYDPSGRLISHTDGFGRVITYLHDIPNRTETVTDRLGHPTVFEYDERGNVLRRTDARGGVTSFTYDANDNVLTETNALGKTSTYTYDANDHRTSITDPLGNLTQFTYNVLGKVLTKTDPLGHVTTNTYNAAGKLLTTEDPLHNVTTFVYSVVDGQRISTTDALNNPTHYEYTGGYLTKETDAVGNETTFTNDSNGNRASQTVKRTNPQGQIEVITTSYEYDKLNRPTKTVFADGSFTRVEYNNGGRQSATINQAGRRTEFSYDEMNRLTQTKYPDGTHEDTTYDAEGRRLTSKDRLGRVTAYTYDQLGRLTKTTYSDGSFTQTTYDTIGRVSSSTDARGNTNTYEYDPNCGCSGRQSKVTDPLGHATTFTYDGNGQQLTATDALNHTTAYEYDANGRRTKTIYPDNTFDLIGYDVTGRITSRTDQAGKTSQFTFDAMGRLIKVTDALGHVTQYHYDEMGEQTDQIDALNRMTRYEYDLLGRRTKRTLPLGQSETNFYATDGRLVSNTDFNGKTTSYEYDMIGRLLMKTPDPTLNQAAVTFTYTASGQRATMSDASGLSVYNYDTRDRLISKQTPEGSLTYTYDEAGNLLTTRSSNPNGMSLDYSYDQLNRLASVKDNSLVSLSGGVTNYAYDAVGNLQSYSYPNGATSSYSYNSLNRLTAVGVNTVTTSVASYSYTLGPAGNRIAVTEFGGRTVNYTYDDLYRLTNESIANDSNGINGTISYSYDSVGNRLSRTSSVPAMSSQNFTYDANDRLQSVNYDNAGNATAENGNSYAYDFENRLTSVNSGSISYVYDGDGNRVARTINGVTTRYLVDTNNLTGFAQVADEFTGGAVTRTYTYGLGVISERQLISNQWRVSFYESDGQGNIRLLTDANGAVTDTYNFDGFGNLLSATGTTPNDRLYGSEQFDANLGFYYLRARYLDPSKGLFTTMDSYEGDNYAPISLHKYLYASANPANLSDPSGHMSLTEQVAVGAIIGVLASMAVFGAFASLTKHYLPNDAFLADPDGVVFGFQTSYPIGRLIPLRNPFTLGLRLGLSLLAGIGGADAVVRFAGADRAWLYAYGGLSSGLGQNLNGLGVSGYVGFVWNVSVSSDYAGPFFCTTLTPHSLSPGLGVSSSLPVSVCSSPGHDGLPGAYSIVMQVAATHGGPRSTGTAQASGSKYTYLHDISFGQTVPRTIQGAQDLWGKVSSFLTP